ncbi:MAG TPA: 2-hydroxyacid dehydrogenase [Chthoniobacterales bacterium]|jgi:D-lactate dehydrogenase
MKIAVFSTKPYDREFLQAANEPGDYEIAFFEERLTASTTVLADGCEAVCIFVNDVADARILERLAKTGTRLILLRCAGFNNVDLEAAARLGMSVRRVPSYSPYAVAEHTLALILTLNRKTHRAFNRVREGNFSIDGLLGFDLNRSTVGIIGTGKIGRLAARPLQAIGCRVIGYDPFPNEEFTSEGGTYVPLEQLFAEADIISLHMPLTPETFHLINAESLSRMKRGVMLINTSRGALVDANALIGALKSGQVGYVGLDVYEQEAELFFQDLSGVIIQDDTLQRLLTFPNVLITSHQAFFTRTAMTNIAETTLANAADFLAGNSSPNEVKK